MACVKSGVLNVYERGEFFDLRNPVLNFITFASSGALLSYKQLCY